MTSQPAKVTVICHIYNEQFMLPWWLNHHVKIFDHGVIIDYHSTDASIEICRKLAPSWEIIRSRNTEFSAKSCDDEVMEIERRTSGWKIVLNVTEFLYCADVHGLVERVALAGAKMAAVRGVVMADPPDAQYPPPDPNSPLVNQRFHGWFEDTAHAPEIDFVTRRRVIHNFPDGAYWLGRHRSNREHLYHPPGALILWFAYSPWCEETISRKLQVQDKIPKSDRENLIGTQHIVQRASLQKKWSEWAKLAIDLRLTCEYSGIFSCEQPGRPEVSYPCPIANYMYPANSILIHDQVYPSQIAGLAASINGEEREDWIRIQKLIESGRTGVWISIAYIRLANIYASKKQDLLACYCAKQAVAHHPYITNGYLIIGLAELRLGRIIPAKAALEIAFSLQPFSLNAGHLFGVALAQCGDLLTAQRILNHVTLHHPNFAPAASTLGQIEQVLKKSHYAS